MVTSKRVAPAFAAAAVGAAAIVALFRGEDTRADPRATASADTPASAPVSVQATNADLPPGHPPIGSMGASHGMQGPARGDEPPALAWTAPPGWRAMPNPNALRVATYRVSPDDGDATEVTVSRAGGSTDANIQRWIGQFDGAGAPSRTERRVGDIGVTVVEVSGTYAGNGMMPAGRAPKLDGWSLVGAIAAPGGTPYFFKMTGPTQRVRAARPAFDAMIASIRRR
jgi:hypothetical protein